MQLCRLDVKMIIISLEEENNYKRRFGNVNNNENLKILAMMCRGFYISHKDFERYSKYENHNDSKIVRTNKKNKLTPFQKMLFCRPIYYDSVFSGKSNIADFRPLLAQQRNKEKNHDIRVHFEILNPVKMINKVFSPFYRKIQFTEYILDAPFKSICELRTYESFSLRWIKTKNGTELLNSAEFVFYWNQDTVITYLLSEANIERKHGVGYTKATKATIFVISSDVVLRKLNDDRAVSMRYAAEIKKQGTKRDNSF